MQSIKHFDNFSLFANFSLRNGLGMIPPLGGIVRRHVGQLFFKSLILAQDECWRRA